ncbi:23902_t:CDS:2 [Cetraspora pellucida]|uniref:23902_t:CDS:1 n=1 Tax=Cetraspora pellucida TaxID=1433469 RepID=A0A9N9H555_9GLOM|nr:23902_t:CDS:2 [Cetraspora pellucida]
MPDHQVLSKAHSNISNLRFCKKIKNERKKALADSLYKNATPKGLDLYKNDLD